MQAVLPPQSLPYNAEGTSQLINAQEVTFDLRALTPGPAESAAALRNAAGRLSAPDILHTGPADVHLAEGGNRKPTAEAKIRCPRTSGFLLGSLLQLKAEPFWTAFRKASLSKCRA